MRRWPGEGSPPPELVVFDGREFSTAAAWEAAFDEWSDARTAWEKLHGVELERRVLSRCPFDKSRI